MYAGTLVEVAPVERLFAAPQHPYTRGLIASVPQVTTPPSRDLMLRGLLRRAELPPGCRFAPRCPYAEPDCHQFVPTAESAENDHIVTCWRWRDIEAAAVEPTSAALPS
jgi:oligopeptide/dipeptide ABC transporter ATP-binding protein